MDTKVAESPKVLIATQVDDVRAGLGEKLRKDGYEVVFFPDGLTLRDYLDTAFSPHEASKRPAVVISDAALSGLGGLEVCEALHHQPQSPPFILLAEQDQLEIYAQAERAGADFVFDKPVNTEELRSVVSWLASREE